ncbi:FKBP-type peptidyl-prolyl cis-trans isomerase [Cryomorphaceae bacterium 1068]|nr:FKBP-type peptidyl-prolyl cis-trans isomerase [Cryomorphaceae bacterium 1068]
MKKLILLLLASPTLLMAQQDSIFYDTGELMNVSFYREPGIKKSRSYYYKTGEFKGETFYDRRGVMNDGYTLSQNGDTIGKSFVPLFNAQAKKDLSFIAWEMDKSRISISMEEKGSGKKLMKGDQVEVWYIGYFEDGSQFDNSDITSVKVKLTLGEGRMLKSFEDALQEFRSGSSGYIRIPYHLAYGDQVMGNLPAKSNLIYYIKPKRVKSRE